MPATGVRLGFEVLSAHKNPVRSWHQLLERVGSSTHSHWGEWCVFPNQLLGGRQMSEASEGFRLGLEQGCGSPPVCLVLAAGGR